MSHRRVIATVAVLLPLAAPTADSQVRNRLDTPQRFVLSEGTQARYKVTEKLAMNTFDNEVLGKTTSVSGAVTLDGAGRVVPSESVVSIDLTRLKTDRARRDSYVQKNTLETARFPTAELRVTEIRGLPATVPSTGEVNFTVVGDFTLHGATRRTSWSARAQFLATGLKGSAGTTVKFADFGITVPRVPVVARVDDPITLELDFVFIRESAAVVAPEGR